MKRAMGWVWGAALCVLVAAVAPAATREPDLQDKRADPESDKQDAGKFEPFRPEAKTSTGTVSIGGLSIAYQAIAGTRLRDITVLEELTLIQIGRITAESEATVSRKLARTRKDLYSGATRALRDRDQFVDDEIKLCFEYAQQEWPEDVLTGALSSRE